MAAAFSGSEYGRTRRRGLLVNITFIVAAAGFGFWDGHHQGRAIADALISAAAAILAVGITRYLVKAQTKS